MAGVGANSKFKEWKILRAERQILCLNQLIQTREVIENFAAITLIGATLVAVCIIAN